MEFQPMSPDEMQRMMQFLLNQRAQHEARFDADMEKLSAKTDRIADGLIGLTSIGEPSVRCLQLRRQLRRGLPELLVGALLAGGELADPRSAALLNPAKFPLVRPRPIRLK